MAYDRATRQVSLLFLCKLRWMNPALGLGRSLKNRVIQWDRVKSRGEGSAGFNVRDDAKTVV